MIAKEMARQPQNDLSNVPELSNTTLGKAQPTKLDALDKNKWSMPAEAQGTEAELQRAQWMAAHQQTRQTNVELLQKFGPNAWRMSNFLLEEDLKRLQRQHEALQGQMEELNRSRKTTQTEAGQRLDLLESRWSELVGGNLQLEVANLALEGQVMQLRERHQELQQLLAQTS